MYSSNDKTVRFPTPDNVEFLDKDLELVELLDEIYSLKRHKSPGFDGLTNEDLLSLIPNESSFDEPNPEGKLVALKYILLF